MPHNMSHWYACPHVCTSSRAELEVQIRILVSVGTSCTHMNMYRTTAVSYDRLQKALLCTSH